MARVVKILAAGCGLSEGDVRSIIATAPSRYKTYKIPKRNGGERIISQPARELKFLQRVFVDEILSGLPVHEAAMAYREGISIRNNAAAHVKSGAILKFDFSDFFPSILAKDWKTYCKIHHVFDNDEDVNLSTNILFHRKKHSAILRLAIGAPSSPTLSNILMAEFDQQIAEAVAKDKVRYTRYADDLTFSAKRAGNLSCVEQTLRKKLKEMATPRLRLNEEKTVLVTKKFRRVVTGLVLSDSGAVSLGRERKREIRAMVHHYISGKIAEEEIAKLSGILAFVNAVEPVYLEHLMDKYGAGTISQIKARLCHDDKC